MAAAGVFALTRHDAPSARFCDDLLHIHTLSEQSYEVDLSTDLEFPRRVAEAYEEAVESSPEEIREAAEGAADVMEELADAIRSREEDFLERPRTKAGYEDQTALRRYGVEACEIDITPPKDDSDHDHRH